MILNPLRVLVTAVGGDLGQAVVKALRLSQDPIRIYGCDVDTASIGSAFVESYYAVPFASDMANYLDVLDRFCRSLQIQAVIPTSEPEIDVLSRLGSPPRLPCGAAIVCQDSAWLDTYGDKFNCMRALDRKVELAGFANGNDQAAVARLVSSVGFPLVVKARRSSGSRTLNITQDLKELTSSLKQVPSPIVQEYIDDNDGEFTVGAFVSEQIETMIAFKRELSSIGCSWFAETSNDSDVLHYVRKIVEVSKLKGSANFQVRKGQHGVHLLEINPRFSSTVAARAICDFRDVEWSLRVALGLRITQPPEAYRHIRFRRFFHEMVDFGNGFGVIAEWIPRITNVHNKEVAHSDEKPVVRD